MGALLAQCASDGDLDVESEHPAKPASPGSKGAAERKQQLVCIDREVPFADYMSSRSTKATESERSTRTNAKGMFVLKTTGVLSVPQSHLDREKVREFQEFILAQGLDVSSWGFGQGSKALEQLYWEASEQRACHLVRGESPGELRRVVRLVKIQLVAEIYGVEHVLYSRMQFMHDGQQIERKQVPLRKLTWTIAADDQHSIEELTSESCRHTENVRDAARKVLVERLGLSEQWQDKYLVEEAQERSFNCEDDVQSSGYPGLVTSYCIHWVTFRVADAEPQAAACIGLPHGREFATREGDFNFAAEGVDELGLPIGSQLNIWTWERDKRDASKTPARSLPTPTRSGLRAAPAPAAGTPGADVRLIKRVPLPAVSAQALSNLHHRLGRAVGDRPPSPLLHAAMEGQRTDWAAARKMARNLMSEKYTLAKFSEDLVAFPELHLYLLDHTQGSVIGPQEALRQAMMISGRTVGDEYQRTIGAFYAIFWLLRLPLNGKEGFCFGVDEDWMPYACEAVTDERLYPADKRLLFYREGNWDYFERLLLDAKLITEDRLGRRRLNEKRVVSLLALTAIHDIMKMDMILPKVQEQHAPYRGYASGDTAGDHDHALSYIMDYYPDLLPSFVGLEEDERRAVEFTQCRLQFNHGWFVQGEAPPGALFTGFKEALSAEGRHGRVGKEDVALYFVHWLTDLAGAEPTPLGGCEKFVVKFPMVVLNSFLRSFEFVERIVDETETQVVEEYLKMRWLENVPTPGPLPTGDGAIARMRLLCMAQMNAGLVLRAFNDIGMEDREVLCAEMSLTGCAGQTFSADICPREVQETPYGPAFLIYYGPAFLQKMGNDRPEAKVGLLAEIYRRARVLWPAQAEQAGQNVTIRIDSIKELGVADMFEATLRGDLWLMVKHNESEAFIERSSQRKLNKFISARQRIQVLDIGRAVETRGAV